MFNQVRLWAIQVAAEHPGLERGWRYSAATAGVTPEWAAI
jgi:hypothetical protein